MNWRSTTTPHKLKASTGAEGKLMIVGGSVKEDASDRASLANARVPRYTAKILFPKVIAYILI